MTVPAQFRDHLRLPVIGAPMFIASGIEMVVAQCASGIIGTFPALNARPQAALTDWIREIRERLAAIQAAEPGRKVAPFGVNQVMSERNDRWEQDLITIVREQVPLIITSLRAPPREILDEVHRYGGLVFHDVTNLRHARKAASMGVDGLILVAAGAGGQGGDKSPFALVNQVKEFFDGTIILSGAMSTGRDVYAAQAMGADFAYLGTRFLAAAESNASEAHKEDVIASGADDIIYTNMFTGIYGNYIKQTIAAAGFDLDNLPKYSPETAKYRKGDDGEIKVWKDIRGCGHGCGSISGAEPVAGIVDDLARQYRAAAEDMNRLVAA
ncbi:nitronate monooxygenase family protein [uncultured Sphingomonas sp.]|uniref:NAD(P)H-dependent flavin oxidoreductase n=1 Tax=uncultured Sphingomonas sp. TaxID=158754 RepID=UPI002625AF23|nr:nitronate monooxygenase family protein [uncultured Sphingomonas sp.]